MTTIPLAGVLILAAAAAGADLTVCADADAAVPDNDPAGVVVEFIVQAPADSAVGAVEVDIDLLHPWVGDLVVSLHAPDSTAVTLLDRVGLSPTGFPGPFGCGGPDILATFTDDATAGAGDACAPGVVPVIAGVVTPARPLAAFVGAPVTGVWSLRVSDASAYDAGVLRSACLRITLDAPCPPDLAEPFGVLNFFDVSAFLAAYGAQNAQADFAEPFGVFNFFDVSAFLALYNAGCP